MENSHASPGLLKQANSSALHRVLREKGAATRAQLAAAAGVSVTTVRALLEEMLRDGEVECTGLSASSGGRRAAQYSLRRDKYYGAAVCITDGQAQGLLVDVHGEIVRAVPLKAGADGLRTPVLAFLDGLFAQRDIRSIGLGLPGVVREGCFWHADKEGGLHSVAVEPALSRRYGVPVVLENDVNAAAIGFARPFCRGAGAGSHSGRQASGRMPERPAGRAGIHSPGAGGGGVGLRHPQPTLYCFGRPGAAPGMHWAGERRPECAAARPHVP